MDTKLILDIIGDFFEILLAYLFFQVFLADGAYKKNQQSLFLYWFLLANWLALTIYRKLG